MFSNALVLFEQSATCFQADSFFRNSFVSCERFAPRLQFLSFFLEILQSVSSGLLVVLKFSRPCALPPHGGRGQLA